MAIGRGSDQADRPSDALTFRMPCYAPMREVNFVFNKYKGNESKNCDLIKITGSLKRYEQHRGSLVVKALCSCTEGLGSILSPCNACCNLLVAG